MLKKSQIPELVLSLFPLGLVLINIKLFNIGDAAFKPIHVIVIITIILGVAIGINIKRLVLMLIYAMIPLFAITNIVSINAFISTYLIYLLSLMLIFLGLPPILKSDIYDAQRLFRILFHSFNFTAVYGIIQFILANIFTNYSLYNNLGRFQFHPHLDNQIFGITRATSIYIEPSVFAWIATTILVLAIYLRKTEVLSKREYNSTIIFAISSVLISCSAAGFISLIVILIILTFNIRRSYLVILSRWVLFFIAFIILLIQPNFLAFLRLNEIGRQNTSGYLRIVEPYYAMKEILTIYTLFGRGLGQIGVFDQNIYYNVYIHNSLFGVVITFGITSLFYYIPILLNFKKIIKRDKQTVILLVNLLFIFLSTGSFLSLEMPLIYCLYLFAIQYKLFYKAKEGR